MTNLQMVLPILSALVLFGLLCASIASERHARAEVDRLQRLVEESIHTTERWERLAEEYRKIAESR